ncbi:MAG: iron-containing alcohol dehydrogenase [Candidatus Tectomicrobia bacterium]
MPEVLKGQIRFPKADNVIFGPGCMQEHLPNVLQGLGAQRAFLVTTPSLTRSSLLPRVRETLGSSVVGEFSDSQAHTPKDVVLRAVHQAREANVDVLVSFGGSSVVDLAKAVALVLAEGEDLDRMKLQTSSAGFLAPGLPEPKLPHIALPTTLSGAEFTAGAGITDTERGIKEAYVDQKLTPRVVLLDPELTRSTPALLWAGTGMKIFSDALEVLCSPRATPYSDAQAHGALAILYQDLPEAVEQADDVARRGRCLFAAFMVVSVLPNTGAGLVAALRHQLGGRSGVPHGIASTLMLPHVLRWNLLAATGQLAQAARTLGIAGDTEDPEAAALHMVDTIEDLMARFKLPRRLRDVDVVEEVLPQIAEQVADEFTVATNPRPVQSSADVLEVLQAAW